MKRLIEWVRKRQRKQPPVLPENPYRPIYGKPRRLEQLFPKPPKMFEKNNNTNSQADVILNEISQCMEESRTDEAQLLQVISIAIAVLAFLFSLSVYSSNPYRGFGRGLLMLLSSMVLIITFSYLASKGTVGVLRHHYLSYLEKQFGDLGWVELSTPIITFNLKSVIKEKNFYTSFHFFTRFSAMIIALLFAMMLTFSQYFFIVSSIADETDIKTPEYLEAMKAVENPDDLEAKEVLEILENNNIHFEPYTWNRMVRLTLNGSVPIKYILLLVLPLIYITFVIIGGMHVSIKSRDIYVVARKKAYERRNMESVETETSSHSKQTPQIGDKMRFFRYALYPKSKDKQKIGIIVLGWVFASRDMLILSNINSLISAILFIDVLVYQTRYIWNDIRGLEDDRGKQGRLPVALSENEINTVKWATAVIFIRIIITIILILITPMERKAIMTISALAIFILSIVYELSRSGKGIISNIATCILVGIGYPLRFVIGYWWTLNTIKIDRCLVFMALAYYFYGVFSVLLAWENDADNILDRANKVKTNKVRLYTLLKNHKTLVYVLSTVFLIVECFFLVSASLNLNMVALEAKSEFTVYGAIIGTAVISIITFFILLFYRDEWDINKALRIYVFPFIMKLYLGESTYTLLKDIRQRNPS